MIRAGNDDDADIGERIAEAVAHRLDDIGRRQADRQAVDEGDHDEDEECVDLVFAGGDDDRDDGNRQQHQGYST